MRQLYILIFILIPILSSGQDKNKLFTYKYAGNYSFGKNPDKERTGNIVVYPETDSTVLFQIFICNGPPIYHIGSMYNRWKIKNDTCIFYLKFDYSEIGCKWKVIFKNNTIQITTFEGQYDCEFGGFGGAVKADGIYKRKKIELIPYFHDGEGAKVFFDKVKPEDY